MNTALILSSALALLIPFGNFYAPAATTKAAASANESISIMDNERITYFCFDHHNTMVMNDGENYTVSMTEDGRIHIVIDKSLPGEMELFTNDTSIFDDLLAIVKEFKTDRYRSEYRPMMHITDGDSWSLYYRYDSKRSVQSSGYMEYPKNYRQMRKALSDYFKKWRESGDQ